MNAAPGFSVEIQTQTGWGRVLQSFAAWCQPQPGWQTLDVGCGPGLLPALLAAYGCRAFGLDLEPGATRLHPHLARADARRLPFPPRTFDLLTASNLLFFLPDPQSVLAEMARLVQPEGRVALLNPSERMSIAAAADLAAERGLQGLERASLCEWAARAEAHHRWDAGELAALFKAAGLRLEETTIKMGPGLARLAMGKPATAMVMS